MKRLFIFALLSTITLSSIAQTVDLRRKIEVSGSAETEITPDIIYIAISLKEYFKDNNNKNKVEIDELERQLQSAVLKAGIPQANFTINNISSYNYTLEKKKNPGFLARKQYRLKVTDLTKFNQILAAVDPRGIEYTNIESYDHSKIESLKKELKIKALQAAKEKADYLAAAVNDKVYDALEIQEINNEVYPQPIYRANAMYKTESMAADAPMPEIDFKKIKLSYQMRAIFEIR
ncbi:SIMPL domain-containing protein [Desertivirga xinjiangensis]|uniref:SIMPL domain-containing protein n=1 Tax=Desertivirga xinjiangensis TaxID=539206 RepID=UPI00210F087E|nr:SIMPL domain-containing protein [Pedobacter xinjiangensis]